MPSGPVGHPEVPARRVALAAASLRRSRDLEAQTDRRPRAERGDLGEV